MSTTCHAFLQMNESFLTLQVRVLSLASFGTPASSESVNDDFSVAAGKPHFAESHYGPSCRKNCSKCPPLLLICMLRSSADYP